MEQKLNQYNPIENILKFIFLTIPNVNPTP